MIVAETIDNLQSALKDVRVAGTSVGFVPTMGALHIGHRSLIETAKGQSDTIVVSIFVNPAQFAQGEDLDAYPRPIEADLEICRELGVDVVFLPSVDVVYPDGWSTVVQVPELSDKLCGLHRAGHFDGVSTVVARLFGLVRPDQAFFGEKDFQQLRIVERMTQDLALGVEIVSCPTVREPSGLAVSSRNAYLSDAEQQQAASLHRAMMSAVELIQRGERDCSKLIQKISSDIRSEGDCEIEYISVVDFETLCDLTTVADNARICVAVRIGNARLIDNVSVDDASATR